MVFKRNLLSILTKTKKSILLIGPRQTGKSTLIQELKADLSANLADESVFSAFARNPNELRARIKGKKTVATVFIDEIQRLPSLLNTVQALLDEHKGSLRFFITGSSARKLKRGRANLLPGRILSFRLGPLVASELASEIDNRMLLSIGSLPGIYFERSDPIECQRVLRSYASTYLKEEIQAEALTRNIEGFARFLYIAAASATQFLDFKKSASEAAVPFQSARRYFEILEDTLIVQRCTAFAKSDRRRLIQHPRYFFFDNGVLNALLENFEVSSDRKGMLFENLLFSQILHSADSFDKPIRISTYRTEAGAEIDFIVELEKNVWAIEAKASERVSSISQRGFDSFKMVFGKPFRKVIAYLGETPMEIDGVSVLPWQTCLQEMGLTKDHEKV